MRPWGRLHASLKNRPRQDARHGIFPGCPRSEPSDFWGFHAVDASASALMRRSVPKWGCRSPGPTRFFGAFQDIEIWDFRRPSRRARAWRRSGRTLTFGRV